MTVGSRTGERQAEDKFGNGVWGGGGQSEPIKMTRTHTKKARLTKETDNRMYKK